MNNKNNTVNFLFEQFNQSEINHRTEIQVLPASFRQDLEVLPIIGSDGNYDYFMIPFEDDFSEIELIQGVVYFSAVWSNIGKYLTIRCRSNERYLFSPFLADLLEQNLNKPIDAINNVKNEWRTRWGQRRIMSLITVKGLFGELIVLRKMIEIFGDYAIKFWNGPEGSLHDFSISEDRIEVKSSSSANPRIKVSRTLQLIPLEDGKLYLHLVRINQGSGITISEMINQVRDMISQESYRIAFQRKLSYLGNDEDFLNFQQLFQLDTHTFTEVNESTPILHMNILQQFPPSISEIVYSLDADQLGFTEVSDFFWDNLHTH
jgi:hypothetical protein